MDKKVIVRSQESCPTRLGSLSNGMTGFVEEGRGIDIVYLYVSKFSILYPIKSLLMN